MSWIEELRQRDPDRAGAALLAPRSARPRLLTLAALNAELSRVPFASADPLLSQIRAQWWIEALERIEAGGEGETPLLKAVSVAWGAEASELVRLAEGWREGCAPEARRGVPAILSHLDATAGEAMWQAARILGAGSGDESAVRAQGRGTGVTAWLRAGGDGGAALSEAASQAFEQAAKADLPAVLAPALYPGTAPQSALRATTKGEPVLHPSEFSRRLALLRFGILPGWRVRRPR